MQEWVSGEVLCFQRSTGQNLFSKSVTVKFSSVFAGLFDLLDDIHGHGASLRDKTKA